MNAGIHTVIYPVTDLARAKALYAALLGVDPYADAPYYVGFRIGDQEFGLDTHGHDQGMTGPRGPLRRGRHQPGPRPTSRPGAEQQDEIRDIGDGRLIVTVKDADGNVFGLLQSS